MDYSNVYKKIKDSIVNVIQLKNDNICSTASGVLIDDGRKILTCNHCVNEQLQNAIYDLNSQQTHLAKVIFSDRNKDIAILEISSSLGKGLTMIKSGSLEIGNEVFTVGFPYTFPSEKTLTSGHIAAFEKGLIKIDTSVNNGNSGGPLFNIYGDIIGIVNAKLGSLSKFLEKIEQERPKASINIGGIDPVSVIQQMLREMKKNLNLGIGYAVPTDTIANTSPLVKSIIK